MQVADWLAADGPLAAALPRFESRLQQQEMAAAVAAAFAAPHHLAVEAGTGVGKTFAYLLPAIEQITAGGGRVVVSTHTIALQEQLIHKDIPLLQQALGADFKAELVKGRHNYLGLRRLKQASERQAAVFKKSQLPVLHQIEDWAYVTQDGSRADLGEAPDRDVWEKVRSEHGNCLGRRCPTYEPCFYQRARRRAEQAQLLVVNHALLVADLLLRQDNASVLPDYNFVIVDEAHTLDQVAADHLGFSVSNVNVQHLLGTLFNDRTGKGLLASLGTDTDRHAVVHTAGAATEFFNDLANWQARFGRSNGRLVRPDPVANELSPALQSLVERLAALRDDLPREEERTEMNAALERARELAIRLADMLQQRYDEHVYWIESGDPGPRRVALCTAPLQAGPFLRQQLFDPARSVVLTSATLAVAGSDPFAYIRQRLGAPELTTAQLGSPFDFEQQATVYIEAGMPDPGNYSAFLPAATSAIVRYLRETEGRAFVLFTSYRMLQDAVEIVRDDLNSEGYTVLAQGEDLPRSKMLDVFRTTPRCVIFGTDSFWQGVDVSGAALSNVIITKLPFAVPDRPTIEARIDLLRRGGQNPFQTYQLPEAILRFRQGFGRLIRSQTDTGIVVILDPRVLRKPYGKQFLNSLPPCRTEISQQAW